MPLKPQTPGPNPTALPSAPFSSRSRKLDKDTKAGSGRAGSAGGIVLSIEQKGGKEKEKGDMSSTANVTGAPPPKDTVGPGSGPSRQRRRPRKLNKEPVGQNANTNAPPASMSAATNDVTTAAASTIELEALKSRVRGLEAKVEDLYKSGADIRGARSPRRRGKGRKGSAEQQPTITSATATDENPIGKVEEIEEGGEELSKLEGELDVARQDLESYRRLRPRNIRLNSGDTEYIEEIPRDWTPTTEDTVDTGDRQITLTGSYRIPLPSTVSMADVKSIQSGVSAVQNVARSFLEQRRAPQAVQGQEKTSQPPRPRTTTRTGRGKPASTVKDVAIEANGGQTWGEWFGGYSMAISRAVKNIEAETAIESQKATGVQTKATMAPKTIKPAAGGVPRTTGQRPPFKPRAGNLSSEQVQGLIS
ncbi:uncharacterized protein BDR25DRAFT_372854 [Lindgomyces ingoldianus]|uniref:Uncharacterized protein n=1 Tax=Lindgomyces ingoldianus TaxID=673940 RepID=A0ACB6QS12_9PLEO|nr:uncharacterized protein BDR25DRAFT_372854 [Lindgomyces ingoldianus]KAF2468966.1 hypothetical protein BDR25DRAFT_372854 [Lindgomyces ingoldianus]